MLSIFGNAVSEESPLSTRSETILKVAMQDDIKTRNILASNDVWTSKVLWRCYDSVLNEDPDTHKLLPHIALGTDNRTKNNRLDEDEIGLFGNDPGEPYNVTVFYNFHNIFFHDGMQMKVEDILASYHIYALHPRWCSDLCCLMDKNGLDGNFSSTRYLFVWEVNDGDDDDLTSALHFQLQEDFALFYKETLSIPIFPRHIWEGTGSGIHEDFGKIIDEEGQGVPPDKGGFDINKALAWDIVDDSHVIGSGPFKFEKWEKGAYIKIERYAKYSYKKPNIDGILFRIYRTTDAAVMALSGGEVDYIAWSIPADYIPDLMGVENIGLSYADELGFFYLSFNMRKPDFGYDENGNDIGKAFRKAVAHCVDKKTIVTTMLQNFGTVADGPISPTNEFWYNDSLPQYDLDIEKAKVILDNAGILDKDGDGWRELPTLGDAAFEILTPPYRDPFRRIARLTIATNMQNAGINVVSKPTAFGEIVRRIDARDFDMYILGWSIGSTDPDFLYSFFHSGNAEKGNNYPGYNNSTFDEKILASRKEMNETKRQKLIKECQGILAEDLPYIVLYFRQNVEAYRADNFVNWTLSPSGTIFNSWSLLGIHKPYEKFLHATISTASAVISNGTAEVVVKIRDQDGNSIQGAKVYLQVENSMNSNLTGALYPASGMTDINGRFYATFKAPYVPPYSKGGSDQTILIYVRKEGETWGAIKDRYNLASITSTPIIIKPAQSKFLCVSIKTDFDLIPSRSTIFLDVLITDQDNLRVDGAQINVSTEPAAALFPQNGSITNGEIRISFTAPKVSNDTIFIVEVHAAKIGYEKADQTIEILVLAQEDPINRNMDAQSVISIFVIMAITTIIYTRKKKMVVRK
jgi:ABC-type transport system substrate-binding protein